MESDLKITNTHDRTRSSDSRICGAFHGARSKTFHKADTLTVVKVGRHGDFHGDENLFVSSIQRFTCSRGHIYNHRIFGCGGC